MTNSNIIRENKIIISNHLKDNTEYKFLGLNSFETFLNICSQITEHAIDDVSLANKADAYKIYICYVQKVNLPTLKSIIERYDSMELLLHYLNINIAENNTIGLYIKLNYTNKWQISYGITDCTKLYKVGEFDFNLTTNLPNSSVLKYLKDIIDDFDARKHLLVYTIKRNMQFFSPGACQKYDVDVYYSYDTIKIVVPVKNLGSYVDYGFGNIRWQDGEIEKYMQIFNDYVIQFKWASMIKIKIDQKSNKFTDFIIIV